MKTKNNQQQSPLMVEDKATEKLKKRLQDLGLIVNAGAGKKSTEPAAKKKAKR